MARLADLLPRTRNAGLVLAAAAVQFAWASPPGNAPAKPSAPVSDPFRPLGANPAAALKAVANMAGAAAPAPGSAEVLPRLQATRRNEQGVWVALIDERWRSVGDRHGDSVVAAIRAGDVMLTQGNQRTLITLLEARATASKTNLDKP